MVDDVFVFSGLLDDMTDYYTKTHTVSRSAYSRNNEPYPDSISWRMSPADAAHYFSGLMIYNHHGSLDRITSEQASDFNALFTSGQKWKDVWEMYREYEIKADEARKNDDLPGDWRDKGKREYTKPNQGGSVDDIFAFQAMFSTIIKTNQDKIENEDTQEPTLFEATKSLKHIKNQFISEEQKDKFIAKFYDPFSQRSYPWGVIPGMNNENDMLIHYAKENGTIKNDWDSLHKGREGR